MVMTAVCNMNNCRRLCPDDEPFCSYHRTKEPDWKARAEAAEAKLHTMLCAAECVLSRTALKHASMCPANVCNCDLDDTMDHGFRALQAAFDNARPLSKDQEAGR